MMYSTWNMVCDGQTDRRKKWHIEGKVTLKREGISGHSNMCGNGIYHRINSQANVPSMAEKKK